MPFSQEAFSSYFSSPPDDVDLSALDLSGVPRHLAVIMDGNGRWAKNRGLDRSMGHVAGVDALRETITASVRMGVGALSVYAFSTENWHRPKEEVDLLMGLFASTLVDELPLMHREDVRLRYLGDMGSLPQETRDTFLRGLRETADHKGLELVVAVNYGSRAEIARAARRLAERCVAGELEPSQVDEAALERELYTYPLPDPDLLVRTSGEKRLSNFLLWQLSYAEMIFSDVLWPDFDRWELVRCVLEYQGRQRRFGGV